MPSCHEAGLAARLDYVIASASVGSELVNHACSLSGASLLTYEDIEAGLPPSQGRTVLFLVAADESRAYDLSRVLSQLALLCADVGVVLVSDSLDARHALDRMFDVAVLPSGGRASFISSHPVWSEALAPPALVDAASAEALEPLSASHDLLCLSGHANALDLGAGPAAIVCALKGVTGTQVDAERTLPCFSDGHCFRQAGCGLESSPDTARLSPGEFRAQVLVLAGCNVFSPGRLWQTAGVSLAVQTQASSAVASIVTAGLFVERPEIFLLLLSLLADGRTLGEAVRRLNVYEADHGFCPGLDRAAGPFVLLGHPALRFGGGVASVQTPPHKWLDGSLHVDLSPVRVDEHLGALLVFKAPNTLERFATLDSPESVWVQACVLPEVGRPDAIHLWINGSMDDAKLRIDFDEAGPYEGIVEAISCAVGQVTFWLVWLDHYRARADLESSLREALHLTLDRLPRFTRALARATNVLTLRPRSVVPLRAARQQRQSAWHLLCDLHLEVLARAVDVATSIGTLQFFAWEESFLRADEALEAVACSCGAGAIRTQNFYFAGSGSLRRGRHHCSACGPSGEDDGRALIQVVAQPRVVLRGSEAGLELEVRASDNEFLQVHSLALIECWRKRRKIAGDIMDLLIEPGCRNRAVVTTLVPVDLTIGIYPLVVIAVANGALYILRRMISVADNPDERDGLVGSQDKK